MVAGHDSKQITIYVINEKLLTKTLAVKQDKQCAHTEISSWARVPPDHSDCGKTKKLIFKL